MRGGRLDARRALAAAIERGTAGDVRELCRAGADANAPVGGAHPIFAARRAAAEPWPKVDALIAAGARVDGAIGPKRWGLLGFAAFLGDRALVECLLKHRALPNRLDRNGLAPIQMARISGRADIVELLREWGADDRAATLTEIEPNFIADQGLFSQVHESVKAGLRGGRAELARMEVRFGGEPVEETTGEETGGEAEAVFRYHISLPIEGASQAYVVEIVFLARSGIHAVLLEPGVPSSVADFVREFAASEMTLRDLRAVIHRVLEEIASGKRGRRGREPGPEARADPAGLPTELRAAYFALGLEPGAGASETLRAYRRLAKAVHPDLAADAGEATRRARGEKMSKLNAAYAVLKKTK